MEYLVLTAFILISVAIIFTFSFINYNQNIRVAQANEAIARIANAVDDVYTSGEGNTRFVTISFPNEMKELKIVHKCVNLLGDAANQGTLTECGGDYDDNVSFSAISINVNLLSGENQMLRETKAKIWENLGEMALMNGALNKYSGSGYVVRVSWTADKKKIMLEKV